MSLTKLIVYSLFILVPLSSYGQNGLFVNPYVGAGFTDIITKGSITNAQKTVSTTGGNIGVNIGYSLGRLRLTTGISFLSTGNETEDMVIFQNLNAPYEYDSGRISYMYRHITVPVKVGYTVLSRKVSFTPELGIMPTYTLGQWARFNSQSGNQGRTEKMSPNAYSTLFNKISVFGTLDILMAIHFNDKFALSISPAYYYMLTNLQKLKGPIIGVASQRHYAAMLNIGVILKL